MINNLKKISDPTYTLNQPTGKDTVKEGPIFSEMIQILDSLSERLLTPKSSPQDLEQFKAIAQCMGDVTYAHPSQLNDLFLKNLQGISCPEKNNCEKLNKKRAGDLLEGLEFNKEVKSEMKQISQEDNATPEGANTIKIFNYIKQLQEKYQSEAFRDLKILLKENKFHLDRVNENGNSIFIELILLEKIGFSYIHLIDLFLKKNKNSRPLLEPEKAAMNASNRLQSFPVFAEVINNHMFALKKKKLNRDKNE